MILYFFFFKQNTAYEMRISDWSSDVCSSDLRRLRDIDCLALPSACLPTGRRFPTRCPRTASRNLKSALHRRGIWPTQLNLPTWYRTSWCRDCRKRDAKTARGLGQAGYRRRAGNWLRSEEHTSELQSLMRISYAVFCLKK